METRKVVVYGLASSEDGQIRYVGQTVRSMVKRLQCHKAEANRFPHRKLSQWLTEVIWSGNAIIYVILDDDAVWNVTEVEVIADFLDRGLELVNETVGGDGTRGRFYPPLSEKHKKRISEFNKGRKPNVTPAGLEAMRANGMAALKWLHTPEARAKVSASMLGRIPANLASIHANLIGVPKTAETRARISKTLSGRKQNPELVAKRRDGFKKFLAENPAAVERRRAQLAILHQQRRDARKQREPEFDLGS